MSRSILPKYLYSKFSARPWPRLLTLDRFLERKRIRGRSVTALKRSSGESMSEGMTAPNKLLKLFMVGFASAVIVVYGLSGRAVSANVGGPPAAHTGAPGEATCTECHNSFALNSGPGSLTITGLPATYSPNQEITITVTLTHPSRPRYGFQVTAIDDSGRLVGALMVTDPLRTQLVSGAVGGKQRHYIEHTFDGVEPVAPDQGQWSFSWITPASSVGRVTFYAVGNAANGNGSPTGDFIYAKSASIQPPASCQTISNLNPGSGAVGSSVTITGTALTGVTAVKFAGNVAAQFTINSATQITAIVPPGALTGPITLSKPNCPDTQTSAFTVILAGGSLSGTINYGTSSSLKAVPGVTLTAAGTPSGTSVTDESGNYSLPNLGGGPYSVTPTKTGAVNGISSFDASLVAQHVAGIITLSPNQQIAGDASGNGALSSFDASLISQTVAGIPNTSLVGTWKFLPATLSFPTLSGNLPGQNFEAILVGDVSGNWTPPASSAMSEMAAQAVGSDRASDRAVAVSLSGPAFDFSSLALNPGNPGTVIRIPLTVGDLTGLGVTAYDFELLYDPRVLRLHAPYIETGESLSRSMQFAVNATQPGRLRVAAFGAEAVKGSGALLSLLCEVIGQSLASPSPALLTWRRFQFNEGEPAVKLADPCGQARLVNVSAASFRREELARESIVTAFGLGLTTITATAESFPLPESLAGTRVVIRDSAGVEHFAPLLFVSPGQVNYQIPAETAPGVAVVTITSSTGSRVEELMEISDVAPGIFAAEANGQGAAAAVAVRLRADGSQQYSPVSEFDATQQRFINTPIDLGPASEQVFLMLYGTGLRFHRGLSAVSVKIGEAEAEVTYVGPAPGFAGLDQVNALVPRSLSGEVEVVVTVDGRAANIVKVRLR